MNQFATVIPEGLKLHRKSDFASEIVTELAHGDRVKVLQRRQSPGGTPLAEVMVSRTRTGIQIGMVGWARDSLLQVEVPPAPLPPPPIAREDGRKRPDDVPRCEPDEECKPLPLGKYIAIGLAVVFGLALLAWAIG
jgi:hypothetical protein